MKRTSKRVIAFFLILVLVLSLCACAQKQQAGTDEPNRSADGETLSGMPDQKLPEKLRPGGFFGRQAGKKRASFVFSKIKV